MVHRITVLPGNQNISAPDGAILLDVLRQHGLTPEAPCGGNGRCEKCKVTVDGQEMLACNTQVCKDMTVTIPNNNLDITTASVNKIAAKSVYLAIDIGTTTVAGVLLDAQSGKELASGSMRNPQASYGADVISRIGHALKGHMAQLTGQIRKALEALTLSLCKDADIAPEAICRVCIVGNPAMQQLYLGILPQNLAKIPFEPVLKHAQVVAAAEYLPLWKNAEMQIVPDISGFVGADTVACMVAADLDKEDKLTLLVDIGTNGEMVMGSKNRMVACSAAAGPALEGANISCGMRAAAGAIDSVQYADGKLSCHVMGDTQAQGICGSGLVDAVAAALEAGLLNRRGNTVGEDKVIPLKDQIVLTQEDIRQVQLAKGAIAAGIRLMAEHLEISLAEIEKVYLAGAFGSYMDPDSAYRMGLLPRELQGKTVPLGNAALTGAMMIVTDPLELTRTQRFAQNTEFIELAALPGFRRCFAKSMEF